MVTELQAPPIEVIQETVRSALAEDVGTGDLTGHLLSPSEQGQAFVITREPMVVCGKDYFNAVFQTLDPRIEINWSARDGESLAAETTLCTLSGNMRALLTGERTGLNFLQTLSGTATTTSRYVAAIQNTKARLLDTRKTLPGLRLAQKYAVRCGGGYNHRMGLYDAFLIKENHITACGSLTEAVRRARAQHQTAWIEVEVENLEELREALEANVEIIMLDNFTLADQHQAVQINQGRAKLEVSGNVRLDTIRAIAETGVDFISCGALTKNVHAIDLSMRVQN